MKFVDLQCAYSTLRFIILTVICASLFIQQANAQQLLWQRIIDRGNEDYASGVATDSKGNIIIVGTTFPWEIQPRNHEDFLTVKYNCQGETLWTRQYNLTIDDGAEDIAVDKLDNIIVVGYIVGDSTGTDMHIVKYDPDGNIFWTRTYSGGGKEVGEFAFAVATDSKNNIVVTGQAYYNFGDYVTLKYDSIGNLLWIRSYDGGWEDYAQAVALDDSDNVIVTGYSDSNINWDWCTIKYTPNGDTIWVRRYDVAITDWAFGVATDRQGNVIVVGESHYFYPGSGGSTGMIVKYTPQGDTLWARLFTDTLQFADVSKFVGVTTDDRGNIYLAGDYARWDTSGKLWVDYYVAKCTQQGNTLWATRCDLDWDDEPSGIALDRWGNVIVTGTSEGAPGDPYSRINCFTVKLHNVVDEVEGNSSVPFHFALYQNYPNPFNPKTVLSYQLSVRSFVNLKVFDLLGREVETLVEEEKSEGTYVTAWNAARFASGVYTARLTAGNFVASIKLLLIR